MIDFSPFLLLLLVPFVLIAVFARNRRSMRIPIIVGTSQESVYARRFIRACLFGVAVFLVLGIAAPPIPTLKTVIVQSNVECDREILVVLDGSGSMYGIFSGASQEETIFDIGLSALYEFMRNRPNDCFGLVLFSGPGASYPATQEGYAFLINHGIRNPDQLILPLRNSATLQQFSQGTRISEGLVIATHFFKEQAISDAHVVILISDLGNENKDNDKTLEVIDQLLADNVRIYIFGVDVSKYATLFPELVPLIADKKIAYLSVDGKQDFALAYKFVDAIEAAPAVIQKTQITTIDTANSWFFLAAFVLSLPWIIFRFKRRRLV